MAIKHLLICGIFIISLIIGLVPSLAEVAGTVALTTYITNEATKQCSYFTAGDECTSCTPPSGWTQVNACPEGYIQIQKEAVCAPRKTKFCCTDHHSGGWGDCEDLVINDISKQCAFLEDISKCSQLPISWHQADKVDNERLCPYAYKWQQGYLECGKMGNSFVFMVSIVFLAAIFWIVYRKYKK